MRCQAKYEREARAQGFNRIAGVDEVGRGALFGPVEFPEGRLVGKVISHLAPNTADFAAERSVLRDELKTRKARERNELFEAGLRDRLIKEGKVKIHQEVLNRLIANFRG